MTNEHPYAIDIVSCLELYLAKVRPLEGSSSRKNPYGKRRNCDRPENAKYRDVRSRENLGCGGCSSYYNIILGCNRVTVLTPTVPVLS